MSSLREQVANFQVAPKYGIRIGEDNADLLIGLMLERVAYELLGETLEVNTPDDILGRLKGML